MTQYDPEEITKVEVKHPSKVPAARADLCLETAANGAVGNVSGYVAKVTGTGAKVEEKRPQGRPSKFTPEVVAELFSLIERGVPIKTSCTLAGISQPTLSRWKKEELEGNDPELTEFFSNLARARAVAEKTLLFRAMQGDGKEWSKGPATNAQWALERTFGKDYAPRLNMKLEELGDLTLATIERVCSGKDCNCYAEILAALSAAEASGGEAL